MMMMANHADPLDSSCTNTKYMSCVWRNGLEGIGETKSSQFTEPNTKTLYFLYSEDGLPLNGDLINVITLITPNSQLKPGL